MFSVLSFYLSIIYQDSNGPNSIFSHIKELMTISHYYLKVIYDIYSVKERITFYKVVVSFDMSNRDYTQIAFSEQMKMFCFCSCYSNIIYIRHFCCEVHLMVLHIFFCLPAYDFLY